MAEEGERNVIITPDDSNNPEEQGEVVKHLEAVVEGLLNFSVDDGGGEIKNPEEICEGDGGLSEKRKHCDYPLRPHAQDCANYLRTGSCKYGLICKFNHPLGRGFQGDQNQKSWSYEQASQIECKFYQTPEGCKYGKKDCWYSHPKQKSGPELLEGMTQQDNYFMEQKGQTVCKYYPTSEGCKYGNACRYSHSKQISFRFTEKSELAPPELNFLGLPIRELEKECPFYMRTGTCGYGVKCMYNHPDPTAAGGSKTPLSNGKLSGNLNHVSAPVSSLGISETASTSRSSDKSTQEGTFPWLDSSLPYFTHDMNLDSGSATEQRRIGNTNTSYRPYQTIIHEEFPERPDEPHCSYFMKTGNCKFKSACRFHHPKTRAPTLPSGFSLSSKGLPLRPGRQICWHYERSGECRHGLLCLFDHPENFASPTPFPF